MKLQITECPTCASPRSKHVRKNLRRTWNGQTYVVPNLDHWECADCGEHVYDRDAMHKIEATRRLTPNAAPPKRRPQPLAEPRCMRPRRACPSRHKRGVLGSHI